MAKYNSLEDIPVGVIFYDAHYPYDSGILKCRENSYPGNFYYVTMDYEGNEVYPSRIKLPVYSGPYRITLDADEREALMSILLERTLTGLTDLNNLIEQLEGDSDD